MDNAYMDRRRIWCKTLLKHLQTLNGFIVTFTEEMSGGLSTDKHTSNAAAEEKMREKKQKLQQKNQEITACLDEITSLTNAWHLFVQDTEKQQHWMYPFQYRKLGKETNNQLAEKQQNVQTLLLQKRLLEEDLRHQNDVAARESLLLHKESDAYKEVGCALDQRKQVIDDLLILLPGIPELALVCLNPAEPEAAMNLLS